MIYLFAGDDIKKKHQSYEKFLQTLQKAETEVLFVSRNNFDHTQIESLYSGASLFALKSTIVFSNILEYEETRDFILEKLELMASSSSSFVFLEGKLNKPVLDIFKKMKAEMNVFLVPKEKKEKFNNFLLANAFEAKDKLNLWIYFRQAMDKGVGMEELIGVLFWKIKDMLLKKDFRKLSEAELENSARRLSYLLPEARKKGYDAEATFEQFLLEVFSKAL